MTIKRLTQLRSEIARHDKLYDENRPIISDTDYDTLIRELRVLEAQYPDRTDSSSPTQRIITSFSDALGKQTHRQPLLSLSKVNDRESLKQFVRSIPGDVLVQHKLDGLTVLLNYQNGQLQEAVTRGNGSVGELVTHTVSQIANIPQRIPFTGDLSVRGEVILPWEAFERANAEGQYSHPRNLASGTIRQLNSDVAAERGLQFIAYDLLFGAASGSDLEQLLFLRQQGFDVVPTEMAQTADEVEQICQREEAARADLSYAIDGLVIKANLLSVREELGSTSKHPRWATAFKFKPIQQFTTLRSVEWQVGKTGIVAPVAVFDPVDLDGAMTSRATLHNVAFIESLDLRIGDRVSVIRANDVIPRVVSAERQESTGMVVVPGGCPECGSALEMVGAYLTCMAGAEICLAQRMGLLVHFASRDALDIEGLGEVVAEQLVRSELVKSVFDVFA